VVATRGLLYARKASNVELSTLVGFGGLPIQWFVVLLILILVLAALVIAFAAVSWVGFWRSLKSPQLPTIERERRIKSFWAALLGLCTGEVVVALAWPPSRGYRVWMLASAGIGFACWLLFHKRAGTTQQR
jgi:hypothetical protein